LRDYIMKIARERQISTDDVAKEVLKLIMNALYGKFLQNKEHYTETKTFTCPEKWLRSTWKICGPRRNYDIVQGSVNNDVEPFLGTVTTAPDKGILLDTPRLQGFVVLEWSKLIMLKLHKTIKGFYGKRATWAFTDTDSGVLLLQTENYLDDFEEINRTSCKQVFDLRDTGRVAPNAGALGLAKDEAADKRVGLKTILEFAAPAVKMHSMKCIDKDGNISYSMKAKGIPSRDLKRLQRHEDYVNTVMNPNVDTAVSFRAMRSRKHEMEHRHITKRGLTGDNDKVFQLGPNASRPLGHWRNSVPENEKEESQKLFEQECASKWPSLDRELAEFRAQRENINRIKKRRAAEISQ